MKRGLAALFEASASQHGPRVAVEDPARGTSITYEELDREANRVHSELQALGVGPGDRVGVSGKSIGVLAAVLGTLKAGAAYVPIDAGAPAKRSASIYSDCSVRAFVAEPELAQALNDELGNQSDPKPLFDTKLGPELVLSSVGEKAESDASAPEGIAYVLYTSGSTGKPKGVIHTHSSALAFVDWCSEEFRPYPEDRFSSHAPFHFDLSILDIYVPLKHGATLVLIEEELGKQPAGLAAVIADSRISVWYSTPSILRLLLDYGRMDPARYQDLRIVCFAGEVFPIQHLRRLKQAWETPRYYNLYGPTETNVCTFFEVPEVIDPERTVPYPIGALCSDDAARILDVDDCDLPDGQNGELCISGGSVMQGYWNLPDRTAQAFLIHADGKPWYRTGDVVRTDENGDFLFVGRRDRMIKRRGYRIEPGEIEAALYQHPEVAEVAVIDRPTDDGTIIRAFLSTRDGERISLIALKRWCAENLPIYMIPDQFLFRESLPKTSTDKIDYQTLKRSD